MKITYLGQAGLLFEADNLTIMIDPYFSDSVKKINPKNYRRVAVKEELFDIMPDVMIFTHNHLDHYDPETVSRFIGENSKILVLAPTSVWNEVRKLDGNSHIIFHLVEKDGQYYSSALQTGENYTDKPNGESKSVIPKFKHSYGYYECRFKSQKEAPWWSAFWLQSQKVASGEGVDISGAEVDIMEMFDPDTLYPHMIHINGYGKDHVGIMAENYKNNMADVYGKILLQKDVFHRFGCLWEEDGYTFYVDGVQIGEKVTSVHTSVENFILLSTECKGYRGENAVEVGMGKKGFPSGIKDSFIVDYVRVFDIVKD